MNAGEWIAAAVGVTVLLAATWRALRALYRLVRIGETALTRLTSVEKELRPNGGSSLRDRVDATHDIAVDNNDRHTRIEAQLTEAARTAGKAATVAAVAAQQIEDLRQETRTRHAENLRRFAELENNDKDHDILRELLLKSLKEHHGIDLLPDED